MFSRLLEQSPSCPPPPLPDFYRTSAALSIPLSTLGLYSEHGTVREFLYTSLRRSCATTTPLPSVYVSTTGGSGCFDAAPRVVWHSVSEVLWSLEWAAKWSIIPRELVAWPIRRNLQVGPIHNSGCLVRPHPLIPDIHVVILEAASCTDDGIWPTTQAIRLSHAQSMGSRSFHPVYHLLRLHSATDTYRYPPICSSTSWPPS